jgi:hypothetical protein
MDLVRHPIVFLHLPKTAGQTIHNALTRAVAPATVSPIRVHTQAATGPGQFPPGHALYSGHLDWVEAHRLPPGRFAFTVLREPRERIASFYFFLRRDAQRLDSSALARPENLGRRRALVWPAEEYFLGGDAVWQAFIRDHYDNFYCGYFATGRFRHGAAVRDLPAAVALARARAGLAQLDGVFQTSNLAPLEAAFAERYGFRLALAGRYDNAGEGPRGLSRWTELMALLGSDTARRRLEAFVQRDEALLHGRHAWSA